MCGSDDFSWNMICRAVNHKSLRPNKKETQWLKNKLRKAGLPTAFHKLTPKSAEKLEEMFPDNYDSQTGATTNGVTFNRLACKAYIAIYENSDEPVKKPKVMKAKAAH